MNKIFAEPLHNTNNALQQLHEAMLSHSTSKSNVPFSGVKVWNALEPDIKLLSMNAFKARLKSTLISKY